MVLGNLGLDDNLMNGGMAHVFGRSGATWVEDYRFSAWNAESNGSIGSSVAMTAEVILVGSPGSRAGTKPGGVYVLQRSGAQWNARAQLLHSDDVSNGTMGNDIAITTTHAAVAAVAPFPGGVPAVYVFEREE